MDFTIKYDETLKVIVLEAKGEMSLAASKAMIDAEVEMLQKHPEASILYDQTDSNADGISSENIWEISEYSAKLGELLENKKLAVVLQDDLSFGLGRMWKSFTEVKVPFEIQLFHNRADAEKWIVE